MFNSEGLLPVTVFSGDDSVRIWVHERTDQALSQALRLSKRVNGNLHELLVRHGTNFNVVLGYSSSPLSFGMALYPKRQEHESEQTFALRENELWNKGGGEIHCHVTVKNAPTIASSSDASFSWSPNT